ncbi:hypothetical protein EON78_07180, partial [bacterium]
MKKNITILISTLLMSCSNNYNIPLNNESKSLTLSDKQYNYKVSEQKGASVSFKININDFSTKATQSGNKRYLATDIRKYEFYLLKNASTVSYPSGGDPVADTIDGPLTLNLSSGQNSVSINLGGLTPSAPQAYYIGVKAKDISNTDIIKPNNGGTAWSGSSLNQPIAVSTGSGIIVDNNFQISKPSVSITPQLIDGVGAKILGKISPVSGSYPGITSNQIDNLYIKTVAGIGTGGYSGDGGLATNAQIEPSGIALDSTGNIY